MGNQIRKLKDFNMLNIILVIIKKYNNDTINQRK